MPEISEFINSNLKFYLYEYNESFSALNIDLFKNFLIYVNKTKGIQYSSIRDCLRSTRPI